MEEPAKVEQDIGLRDLSEAEGEEEVTTLDLSSKQLTSLPQDVSSTFSKLQTLNLSSNILSELPPELCTLLALRILNLKRNRLKSLPEGFGKLKQLKELNLSGNVLENFPMQLCDLESLEYLHLGGNYISGVPPSIQKLKLLDYLYLGGNQLEELPVEMGQLTNLTALILCDNKLIHLPKQLTNLSSLCSLGLHNNQLQTLPPNLIQLTNLRELSLRNNPLVVRFVKEWPNYTPTLLEIAGNYIKKMKIPYSNEVIPTALVNYLNGSQQCDNPECNGVYFSPHFQRVKFVDFCGKYRLPLLQFLCSPLCVHEASCRYGHDCEGSHSGSEEEEQAAKFKIKKVLLG